MNNFNDTEFNDICRQMGVAPFVEEVTIRYDNSSYFNKVKKAVETDRRGEVVFCVVRPSGKVITVTSREYPKGIFRIPTGGIGHKEDIVKAVYREVREELGLQVEISKFGGVLKLRFEYKEDFVMFYSYIFIVRELGGRLLEDASDDEVSEIREADIEELSSIVNSLYDIPGKWSDWGKFRYATSNAVLNILKSGK